MAKLVILAFIQSQLLFHQHATSYSHHVSSCFTGADVFSVVMLLVVTVGGGTTIPDYILIHSLTHAALRMSKDLPWGVFYLRGRS